MNPPTSLQSSPSASGSPTPKAKQGFFNRRTYPEEQQIKKVAKCVRMNLSPRDRLASYVYVAKGKGIDAGFCKVGWAGKYHLRRIKAIEKCQIKINDSYRIGPFVGAYRIEQILHNLLNPLQTPPTEMPVWLPESGVI